MDDRKNLSDHEALIRRVCATPQNQFAEFTEKKLLYREKALKCLSQLQFDVVLMDVMMPTMDGLEALALIREQERIQGIHMPVIMATAHVEPGDSEKFKQAGADGYVAKPIEISRLQAELARVVA